MFINVEKGRKHEKISCTLHIITDGFLSSCGHYDVDTLTYAFFPYIPDAGYYQEIIEKRWAEIEPDIELVRAEWDCYYDGVPDGIDVIMYDAVVQEALIENGWIQPIDPDKVYNAEDIFPFALEGLTADGRLYGIPALLCGSFMIYDMDCADLAAAEHLTDLADESETLVINSKFSMNRPQYIHEILADTLGEANPTAGSDSDELMALVDTLAVDAHEQDDDAQVAAAYDSGIGKGYIGFSESIRLLNRRISRTGIKTISFSDQDDLPRMYVDAAAVNSKVKGKRLEKSIELMNIIAEADVLSSLSVENGIPQYLLLARQSSYEPLVKQFPIYEQLEKMASNENNRTILGPRP